VYDDAKVSEQVLAQAEEEATRVFRRAGRRTVCGLGYIVESRPASRFRMPTGRSYHLALRIVPWSSKLRNDVFGTAFLSAKEKERIAMCFNQSVEKLHKDWHASLSRVLGHVMAHEIGHLLLGTNAHRPPE